MGRLSTALLAGVALIVTGGAVMAHHSFAMFDQEHPMELLGTVTEFKFTSPHTFILLEVKGTDGSATTWNLEGVFPVKWNGPSLDVGANQAATETLELAHNGFLAG